jgi:hypothetical protein
MRRLFLGVALLAIMCAASSAIALQVIPSKDTYATNETIEIVVFNDSPDFVSFFQPGGIWAVNLETGFVHGFISLAIVYDLLPYMPVELRLGAAIPMGVGEYELVLEYWVNFDSSNRMQESVFLSIEEAVDNEATSAGRLKARYSRE